MAKKHSPSPAPHNPPPSPESAPAPAAESSGFKLPDPDAQPAPPATPSTPANPATLTTPLPQPTAASQTSQTSSSTSITTSTTSSHTAAPVPAPQTDTSSRDLAIGGGVLLAFGIVFLFVKNAYANRLVGKRIPPRTANASGWWLFIFLTCLATIAILGIVDANRFFTLNYLLPWAGLALASLIFTLLTSRS